MWRSIIIALAVICLALLGWYAVRKYPGRVEANLQVRVEKAITAKASGLLIQASQRDIVLTGMVRDEAAQKELRALVAAVSGVKAVHDRTSLGVSPVQVPPPSPGEGPSDMKPPPDEPPDPGPHAHGDAEDAHAAGEPASDAALADKGDAARAPPDAAPAAPDAAPAVEVAAAPAVPAAGALSPAQCKQTLDAMLEGEERITFTPNTGRLTPEGEAKVVEVYAVLQRCPDATGVIEGYHDDYGDPDKLRVLTRKRAYTVHTKLVELGLDKKRFTYAGKGYLNMRYGAKPEVRALNQRIEFNITVE
jgi:outer membrane protein OmpA-like peptidoglycan-associated protein